jgi:hypothetical protein
LKKIFGGEKCVDGKCVAKCPQDKPYVHKDGACHLCAPGWFEYDGNCHTCPRNMLIDNGECICAEGEDYDGTCYMCSEVGLVWDEKSGRCLKPRKK